MDRRTTQIQEGRRTLLRAGAATFGLMLANTLPEVVSASAVRCDEERRPCYEDDVEGYWRFFRGVYVGNPARPHIFIPGEDPIIDRVSKGRFKATSPNLPGYERLLTGDKAGLMQVKDGEATEYQLIQTDTRSNNLLEVRELRNRKGEGTVPTYVARIHLENLETGRIYEGIVPVCPRGMGPERQTWVEGIDSSNFKAEDIRDNPLVLTEVNDLRIIKN